ncbi:MAG: SMP-30/gluconolactonase/LRE family protein [Saprospiraceae bacterium]|nr:SMP-30/gluconolactonase/LRE family protein [Saprospiraceae bacterium]
MRIYLFAIVTLLFCHCKPGADTNQSEQATDSARSDDFGMIERSNSALDQIIPETAKIEVLSEGYEWTEGPVWVETHQMLLFSDIPRNSIFKWSETDGASLYLKPAGFTGEIERKGEPGSNGLLLDSDGNLILCQHGDRRIARLIGGLENPKAEYETIVNKYEGKRFNSPNDATFNRAGDLYFTDPPYGLEGNMDDPGKEIPFQGVYRVKAGSDKAELLLDSLTRPNGIALSPDERILYVANSDPNKAIWMKYSLNEGVPTEGSIFYDATALVGQEKGLPDGLKVHSSGIIFATGPGGVWIFNPQGEVLGKIKTGEATANCAFDQNENYLYITADMYLLRVQLVG